ncbi:DUF5953 family protein [Corallococcus exercitus]|uniref:DUF3396 domain-containing protein n=1 Tax=Corallococcus exercitus TaxID=2316736 RepID=A0A7Y4NIY7_9BACT|nr:hypothetical protein [Corallococcus exercitus]
MTRPSSLTLIVYAPALVGKDARTLDVIHGMEKALPGMRLEWRLSESGRPIAVPQRDAWLLESIEDGGFPTLSNGNELEPVTVMGWGRSGRLKPGGQPQFEVHAEMPLEHPVRAEAAMMLEGMAEGARSYWGYASPYGYGSEVAQQLRRSSHGPEQSPRGLPMLNLPAKLLAPEIPYFIGWLNYWSAAAAKVIGFPDPARDAELLSRARRTATGGWIVRLTEEPLDLDIPAHLETLLRTYERFPAIGGRVST